MPSVVHTHTHTKTRARIRVAPFEQALKPWPNGPPNSSQLEPSYENPNLHRQLAKRYCHVEPARNKIIQLSDYNRAVT